MKSSVVVIPIYKLDFSEYEQATIVNNMLCMSKHDTCIICPDNIDEVRLNSIICQINARNVNVKKLNRCVFSSKAAYNRLCLNKSFY